MQQIQRILLALLASVLLSIPFYEWGTGMLLMVAFIPLLFIEDAIAKQKSESASRKGTNSRSSGSGGGGRGRKRSGSVIWYGMIAFSLFNILTSWWVKHAAWVGIIAATLVGTLYMTLVFWLFHLTRRKLGDRLGYISLVFYWLTFEFLYLRAQINFPWLTLGNAFSNDVMLIQWYEWTGALGGSLWVLLMNVLIFKLIKGFLGHRTAGTGSAFAANRHLIGWVAGLLLIPTVYSLVRFISYEEKDDPYEIVILQPNIDPYMKFADVPQEEQTAYLLRLADSLVTPNTDYIVGPETFINNGVWEEGIDRHPEILKLKRFLENYPKAKIVIGATTYQLYSDPSQFTSTSKPMSNDSYRYDSYNSAIQVDASDEIPIYHKSNLVVGVEFMPYTNVLKFMEKLTVQLGGAFRGHATQEYRETFESPQDGTRVAPVICWESIFGEYVTEYVREEGANFLFIITNDGWWQDTPGHKQHNRYARLRAIENRRSVARSANTGISSFINQRGEELARIGWWKRSAMRGTLNSNDHLTFYVKHGDYLGRMSTFLTVILLLFMLVKRYVKRYK